LSKQATVSTREGTVSAAIRSSILPSAPALMSNVVLAASLGG
jgi:hypothetical protein